MEKSSLAIPERVHAPGAMRLLILGFATTIAATTTDNRIKTILSTVVRLTVQVGCRIARPAKAGTNLDSGTFSTSLLLPRNLKLRSFRGDGSHFDGLTVVETAAGPLADRGRGLVW